MPTAIIAGQRKSSLLVLISVLLGGWVLIALAHRYHRPAPAPRHAAAPTAAVTAAKIAQ